MNLIYVMNLKNDNLKEKQIFVQESWIREPAYLEIQTRVRLF